MILQYADANNIKNAISSIGNNYVRAEKYNPSQQPYYHVT